MKDFVRNRFESGRAPTGSECREMAGTINAARTGKDPEESVPSRKWWRTWVDAHGGDEVAAQAAAPVELARALAGTRENLESWFSTINADVRPGEVLAGLQFNMDEIMAAWGMCGKGKGFRMTVFGPKDKRAYRIVMNGDSMHVTVIICTCADGSIVTHTLILPRKFFPEDMVSQAKNYHWAGSESWWITTVLFTQWVISVFIPHLVKKREEMKLPANARAILWLDGHSSRYSAEAVEALRLAHIDCVFILAKCSHIQQPNDQGVNGAVSQNMRALKEKTALSSLAPAELRLKLLSLLTQALHRGCFYETVQKAWARAGVYPWSLTTLLSHPNVRAAAVMPWALPPKKKKSSIVIKNHVLTGDEVLRQLHERRQEAEAQANEPRGKKRSRKASRAPEDSDDGEDDESEPPRGVKPRKKLRKSALVIDAKDLNSESYDDAPNSSDFSE